MISLLVSIAPFITNSGVGLIAGDLGLKHVSTKPDEAWIKI